MCTEIRNLLKIELCRSLNIVRVFVCVLVFGVCILFESNKLNWR